MALAAFPTAAVVVVSMAVEVFMVAAAEAVFTAAAVAIANCRAYPLDAGEPGQRSRFNLMSVET